MHTSEESEFDFTALGWLQFEHLCTGLLATAGVDETAWRGESDDTRWVRVESAARLRSFLGGGAATVLSPEQSIGVSVLWIPRWVDSLDGARERMSRALRGVREAVVSQAVVVTNFRANETLAGQLEEALPGVTGWVVGRVELAELVLRHQELWLDLPFVLGVRRAAHGAEPVENSSFDVDAAKTLAPTFVVTEAYRQCCHIVRRSGFAVLTGPPEVGKTATARMLAYVQMCKGWEVHECTDPRQFWDAYSADRAQVFVADDAFGATEYRPDAAERWAVELDRILRRADERHWLLWTSRPTPLAASLRRIHREHGVERFPQPSQVMVNAADLTPQERVLMLFRHALAAEVSARDRRVLTRWGPAIVENRYLTPERIRRFVTEHLPQLDPDAGGSSIRSAIAAEIAEPTDAMRSSLAALDDDHRSLLTALLDAPAPPVAERDLAAAVRRCTAGLGRPLPELVDRLSDHFLRAVPPNSIAWVHPSWRDLVIDRLAADEAARTAFVGRCGIDGVLLALSTGGGAQGRRTLPLLRTDADWDALIGRMPGLVAGLDDRDCTRLMLQLTDLLATLDRDHHRAALAELAAVARDVLLARAGTSIDVATLPLLEAWYGLSAALPDAGVEPPDVAALWVETLPTNALVLNDPAGVAALETWATLVAILAAHDLAALARFGFPDGQSAQVSRIFMADALEVSVALPPESLDALREAIELLTGLMPERAPRLLRFAGNIRPRHARPAPPDGPPVHVPDMRRDIVRRVLDDLREPPPPPPPRRLLPRRRRR